MFKSLWGAQQQSPQQQVPDIPTQSWYPPSVLSPSTSSSRPSTPSNVSSSGQSPRVRPPAVGNSNVDSRPQSPSYSQPSPAAGASIIPLLRDKSVDELRRIVSDKKVYNEFFHSIDQVRDQDALHDELKRETTQLARKNLEKQSQIVELKNQCTIIRTTELAAAQERFHELGKQVQESVSFYAPGVLLERLHDAANAVDEESENLHRQILAGELDLSNFIQRYKKLRTIYHRRYLTYLAAKASLSTG
uniref:TSA: Wollemia nobilis Ref_Wollemi_Transcript_29148_1095 transcribed RNA sequence n=1 Tax=Wollemia nobilis TaxID=56998 RepID=A0A0C9S3G7_9CONI